MSPALGGDKGCRPRTPYSASGIPPPLRSSSSGIEEGRFPAGTVLAGRYRATGLLGRGGMGEVYGAHDQILNQAVALTKTRLAETLDGVERLVQVRFRLA